MSGCRSARRWCRHIFGAVVQRFGEGLGVSVVRDTTFRDLVIARVVEPTSILDTGRVLRDLGQVPANERTMRRALARAQERGHRDEVATACFYHAMSHGDVSLVLYDVTTLTVAGVEGRADGGAAGGAAWCSRAPFCQGRCTLLLRVLLAPSSSGNGRPVGFGRRSWVYSVVLVWPFLGEDGVDVLVGPFTFPPG